MYKIELRLRYRANSRNLSFTKKQWETFVLPILEKHNFVQTWIDTKDALCIYQLVGTDKDQTLAIRKELENAHLGLGYGTGNRVWPGFHCNVINPQDL